MPADTQLYVDPDATQQARIDVVLLTTALQQQMKFLDEVKAAYPDTDSVEDQQAAIWNALEQVR